MPIAARGDDFGADAKHLLLAHTSDRRGLHTVRASVRASKRLLSRDAGRLRWTDLHADAAADTLAFGLLAEAWLAAR